MARDDIGISRREDREIDQALIGDMLRIARMEVIGFRAAVVCIDHIDPGHPLLTLTESAVKKLLAKT